MPLLRRLLAAMLALLAVVARADTAGDVGRQMERLQAELRACPDDMATLRDVCILYLNKADFANAIKYGTRLQQLAYDAGDYHNYVIYSHFILGQAYTMKGDQGQAYDNLMQAERNGLSAKNDSALSSVYNGLGIYATNMQRDYYRALTYFFKGLEAARRSHNDKLYNILLSNIAETYYVRRDTSGLKYALECHAIGRKQNNAVLLFYSAVSAANLYLLKGDLARADAYIAEAGRLAEWQGFTNRADVYNVRGNIALRRGQPEQALRHFGQALAQERVNSVINNLTAYYGYGQAKMQQQAYDEAIAAFATAIDQSRRKSNPMLLGDLLQATSRCYELKGDHARALACYKQYHECADSMYSAEKERTVADLRAKYDTERNENKLKQSRLELLQAQSRQQVIMGVLLLLLVTAVLLYIMYRRKNALYKAIVKQNQEAIRHEEALRKELADCRVTGKYASSSLTDDRKQTLFTRLEALMSEQKPYRDHLLTKEKVADMLQTNRTYLSQAINEQTGQTFTSYIGTLRTKEAIRLLSDPHNSAPLKAVCAEVGFSSMTTFYNLFQQTTGMTPATYRAKVVEMNGE